MTDEDLLLELGREAKKIIEELGGDEVLARMMVDTILQAGDRSPMTLEQLCRQVATWPSAPHVRQAIVDTGYGDQVDGWLGPEYARQQLLELSAEAKDSGWTLALVERFAELAAQLPDEEWEELMARRPERFKWALAAQQDVSWEKALTTAGRSPARCGSTGDA